MRTLSSPFPRPSTESMRGVGGSPILRPPILTPSREVYHLYLAVESKTEHRELTHEFGKTDKHRPTPIYTALENEVYPEHRHYMRYCPLSTTPSSGGDYVLTWPNSRSSSYSDTSTETLATSAGGS